MTQQGWSEGQALGTRSSSSSSTKPTRHHSGLATDAERLAAARIGILFKDDNLGLGAKRTGKDKLEGQKTGLDAFQGLLGRLNGKGGGELREVERKVEERRLEMFFLGRWGGMSFVRGGILVGSQGEKEKKSGIVEEEEEEEEENDTEELQGAVISQFGETEGNAEPRRKEEKRQRKEEKRKRKEDKDLRRAVKQAKREAREKAQSDSESTSKTMIPIPVHKPHAQSPDEPVSSAPSDNEAQKEKKPKRKSEIPQNVVESEKSRSSSPSIAVLKNGRHLLRGRNIQAKRMVLEDMKGLDQIFMR